MKKLLTLLLVLPCILSSCADGGDDVTSSNQLVGSWLFYNTTIERVVTNNNNASQAIRDDLNKENISNRTDETWTFHEDGTVEFQINKKEYLSGYFTLKNSNLEVKLYNNGQLEEVVKCEVSLSKNKLDFHYDLTDYYKDEIDELLSGDVSDIDIYGVGIIDSYKRIN